MLIILEGPDGSGKSTLAQNIATHLGQTTSDKIEVWHRGRPTSHPLDEYLRPLYDYRPGTGYHLILDRWHWGEVVYPKVLNRPTDQDKAVFWAIEAYLRRLGALVVDCDYYTTMEYQQVYRERELDGTPDTWQITHLSKIRDEFARMVYRSQLPVWAHMYAGEDMSSYIVSSARHYEDQARRLNDFVTYLGPVKPHTLLLGDVRHGHDPETTTALDPAFVPTKSSSGHFLLRALTSLTSRTWVHGVGVANACDVDDIVKLHETLELPSIISLGKHAYGRVLTSGIKCGVVPHPQYVRRFHHREVEKYGWLIAQTSHNGEDNSRWPQSSTAKPDETSIPTSSRRSGSLARHDPVETVQPAT
jgi:hypothetical protein